MKCPRCGGRLQRHALPNGQVIMKCVDCDHIEETPDLEPPSYNNIRSYQDEMPYVQG